MMNDVVDWYSRFIEPGIREPVRLLRNEGFNTTSSCEHEMYIECEFIEDGELKRLNDTLFNAGFRDYVITATVERRNGCLYEWLRIEFIKGLSNAP